MSNDRAWVSDAIIAELLRVNGGLANSALAAATGYGGKQISNALETLKRRAWVRYVSPAWFLTDSGLQAAKSGESVRCGDRGKAGVRVSERRTFRDCAWRMLNNMGGSATIDELLPLLGKEESRSHHHNLSGYFNALCATGLITRNSRPVKGIALTSPGAVEWILLDYTGPKAPIWRQSKGEIFDPNSGEIYPLQMVLDESGPDKVKRAWGGKPPEWVMVLARICKAKGQRDTARKIGCSPATVNKVLYNKYLGNSGKFEQAVRVNLMKKEVRI
ncbi:MAG: hypothetical protein HQL72_09220 [Magnetococcales bacterium]|nr:hypothetical protein [Magnetococcales bacterium]